MVEGVAPGPPVQGMGGAGRRRGLRLHRVRHHYCGPPALPQCVVKEMLRKRLAVNDTVVGAHWSWPAQWPWSPCGLAGVSGSRRSIGSAQP